MSRRHSVRFACASIAALAVAIASAQTPARLEQTEDAMGSTFSIVLHGPDQSRLQAAAVAAFAELHRLDELLSNYRPSSPWSAINRDAARAPVKPPAELFELLLASRRYSVESGGVFDITVGPLMRVWGFYRGEGLLPKPAAVAAARRRIGYRHVLLDEEHRTVRFDREGIELDPGGIGKGYAVDRMVEILKAHGIESALVSGAGSSIYGLGTPPGEPGGWPIDIRDPRDSHRAVARVTLRNQSLSTSGSYEKFFRVAGRVYSHIMDPRTGRPARGVASVSVIAPRTLDSEVWAKPYFIHGKKWTAAHRPASWQVYFCEDRLRAPCSWVR